MQCEGRASAGEESGRGGGGDEGAPGGGRAAAAAHPRAQLQQRPIHYLPRPAPLACARTTRPGFGPAQCMQLACAGPSTRRAPAAEGWRACVCVCVGGGAFNGWSIVSDWPSAVDNSRGGVPRTHQRVPLLLPVEELRPLAGAGLRAGRPARGRGPAAPGGVAGRCTRQQRQGARRGRRQRARRRRAVAAACLRARWR